MAIDYTLQLDTEKTPEEILELILKIGDFQKNEGENNFFTEGLVGGVRYEFETSRELTEQDFNFIPQIYLWFSPFRDELEEAGMENMMKAIMTVLQDNPGDAVLLMNNEYIVLTRIGGKLILNSQSFGTNDDKWWNIKDVPFGSYEIKELELAG